MFVTNGGKLALYQLTHQPRQQQRKYVGANPFTRGLECDFFTLLFWLLLLLLLLAVAVVATPATYPVLFVPALLISVRNKNFFLDARLAFAHICRFTQAFFDFTIWGAFFFRGAHSTRVMHAHASGMHGHAVMCPPVLFAVMICTEQ